MNIAYVAEAQSRAKKKTKSLGGIRPEILECNHKKTYCYCRESMLPLSDFSA